MAKRTAVVTGASSGLGEAASVALAREGWRVLVIGRDAARGASVVAKAKEAGGDAEFIAADLFSTEGIRALAATIRTRAPKLDLLVNNAGGTFGARQLTTDGLERTFALNVVAPFVLSEELIDVLSAAGGRVLNVVTGVPNGAKATMDQLAGDKANGGMQSYVRAKLALLALTLEQQRRHAERGVTFVALHPGVIPGTGFGQDIPAALRSVMGFVARVVGMASSLEDAAARYVRVGTGPVERGGFYREGKLANAPMRARDPEFATQLWSCLESLTRN